jgi:chromosome segregation ATPase
MNRPPLEPGYSCPHLDEAIVEIEKARKIHDQLREWGRYWENKCEEKEKELDTQQAEFDTDRKTFENRITELESTIEYLESQLEQKKP